MKMEIDMDEDDIDMKHHSIGTWYYIYYTWYTTLILHIIHDIQHWYYTYTWYTTLILHILYMIYNTDITHIHDIQHWYYTYYTWYTTLILHILYIIYNMINMIYNMILPFTSASCTDSSTVICFSVIHSFSSSLEIDSKNSSVWKKEVNSSSNILSAVLVWEIRLNSSLIASVPDRQSSIERTMPALTPSWMFNL